MNAKEEESNFTILVHKQVKKHICQKGILAALTLRNEIFKYLKMLIKEKKLCFCNLLNVNFEIIFRLQKFEGVSVLYP